MGVIETQQRASSRRSTSRSRRRRTPRKTRRRDRPEDGRRDRRGAEEHIDPSRRVSWTPEAGMRPGRGEPGGSRRSVTSRAGSCLCRVSTDRPTCPGHVDARKWSHATSQHAVSALLARGGVSASGGSGGGSVLHSGTSTSATGADRRPSRPSSPKLRRTPAVYDPWNTAPKVARDGRDPHFHPTDNVAGAATVSWSAGGSPTTRRRTSPAWRSPRSERSSRRGILLGDPRSVRTWCSS